MGPKRESAGNRESEREETTYRIAEGFLIPAISAFYGSRFIELANMAGMGGGALGAPKTKHPKKPRS